MKKPFVLSVLIFFTVASYAQVGFGDSTFTPDGSSIVEVRSTDKGMLVPRMNTTQRTSITSPAQGLLVYDTDTEDFWYWDDTASEWLQIVGGGDNLGNHTAENTITVDTDNTYDLGGGTTLAFKDFYLDGTIYWNGNRFLTHKSTNCMIGWNAGNTSMTGSVNLLIGANSGAGITTATYNLFCGEYAGYSTTAGSGNFFMGHYSGYANTSGTLNHFSGYMAGYSNTSGAGNTLIGYQAGKTISTASYNTVIGLNACQNGNPNSTVIIGFNAGVNVSSGSNVIIGENAVGSGAMTGGNSNFMGRYCGYSNTSGSFNTFNGNYCGQLNTSGSNNTFMGAYSGYNNTTTSGNTAIGYLSGYSYADQTNCTFIGNRADGSAGTLSNSTAIGYSATVNASNKVVIGNTSVTSIGGYAAWTNYSDRRLKENIEYNDDLGLDFILSLKPATYNYINDPNKRRRDGLIAQDVEAVLKEMDVEFSGIVKDENEEETLNIAYGEFVIPLINAIQEQQKQIQLLKEEILRLSADN